ncbi:nucleoside-diphosphate-sugar epimerase [Salinibacter ruber]|uniref:NAD-dependent epimerase/dehydratase family protein n=1 Tax=Salinibacter ruber TaxID=146919 RepID=UPI0021684A66|nr:NAD-dependent epimerase/dehydratase family protein [Salinibacter ruber]MCS3935208.1 nucleoside-diphosphate-sugar epimerase [Salinibacter ruber]MCS4043243.1 nucleoside-diphosphate-sugar epimerase [Salinibacter ruber]
MEILVTGSSGFVGSHLVPTLQERGHRVTGIDRNPPSSGAEPDHFIEGDLMHREILDEGLRRADRVFHLAAAKDDWGISREEYFRENVGVTEALLEAAHDHDVYDHVFYSTVAVHGSGPEPKAEDAPFAPEIPYGESKVEAEKRYRGFAAEHDEAHVLVLRPSAIFGERQPWRTNVHRLIEAIYQRRFLMIGDGAARKTTSYIENLLAANFFLLDQLESGVETYLYVDEPVMSTRELVDVIYDELGRGPLRWSLPLSIAKPVASVADVAASVAGIDFPITAARIEKFCTSTMFDASAIRELGFAQPVENEEAVRKTVRWQIDQYE